MGDQISLGAYIFRRIHDLGINHIFGVPGDFNLNLLDHLYTVPGLSWVGNCNELNGAYAADGYARTRGLPGVLVTTFGVGELSALNGIGGAYSEYVPIIHIVGTTARFAQDRRLMIHHTLEEGWDHTTLQRVPTPMSTATCFLAHDDTFTQEVDRVIETCVKTRRPAYMYVPMDVPDLLVDGRRLQTPLDLTITNPGSEDLEDSIVDKIVSRLERAARPCFLVDALAQRFGLTADLRELVRLTGLPVRGSPLSSRVVVSDMACKGLRHPAGQKHYR